MKTLLVLLVILNLGCAIFMYRTGHYWVGAFDVFAFAWCLRSLLDED